MFPMAVGSGLNRCHAICVAPAPPPSPLFGGVALQPTLLQILQRAYEGATGYQTRNQEVKSTRGFAFCA